MSIVSKDIKKQLDNISGKRRLTILQNFVKHNYKKPDFVLKNAVGEYSPNSIMVHLRAVVGHIKQLCTSHGRQLSRYYSNKKAGELFKIVKSLATHFESVTDKTSATALRALLITTSRFLENIKDVIGPFTDIKLASALKDVSDQINGFQDQLESLQTTTAEISSMASTISGLHSKSKKSSHTFDDLVKETKNLHKQLEIQKDAAKEVYERTRTISKQVERSQGELDQKQVHADKTMEKLFVTKEKFELEYQNIVTKAQEFEGVIKRIAVAEVRTNSLSAQAHKILHTSYGMGLLNTYKALYSHTANFRSRLPWIIGVVSGFLASAVLIAFGYLAAKASQTAAEFFNNPAYVFQALLIPFSVFIFFFCLSGLRRKMALIGRYRTRAVAIEAYLKITEKLPLDSQEHTRAANKIMRHIEEDFGALSHAVFQSDIETYDNVV